MDKLPALPRAKQERLAAGLVIPAHPLALTAERRLDERRQRALTRYYLAAGAGGVAVGVHTTEFAIRDPRVGLLRPVLELAMDTVRSHVRATGEPIVTVAGVVGPTTQALQEAQLAADLGYDLVLVHLGALRDAGDDELLAHCRRLAEVRPLFGFYLQPAVGGRLLSYDFWRRLAAISNVGAIKIAPFNRYQTLDVVRGVADSGRSSDIALYTGNDDHIVLDLITPFSLTTLLGVAAELRFVGGLLGQWAVWTKRAVELLERIHEVVRAGLPEPNDILTLANQITDANAALFDPAHGFAGSITALHEILRRQGLLAGRWCLDAAEDLSPGQVEEIDRVCAAYPHLTDDTFVAEHLDEWLS
jgi:dihydrodipicolinate synthase/N-acetylneuraminate lyase